MLCVLAADSDSILKSLSLTEQCVPCHLPPDYLQRSSESCPWGSCSPWYPPMLVMMWPPFWHSGTAWPTLLLSDHPLVHVLSPTSWCLQEGPAAAAPGRWSPPTGLYFSTLAPSNNGRSPSLSVSPQVVLRRPGTVDDRSLERCQI